MLTNILKYVCIAALDELLRILECDSVGYEKCQQVRHMQNIINIPRMH